jgi:hypothetical protein
MHSGLGILFEEGGIDLCQSTLLPEFSQHRLLVPDDLFLPAAWAVNVLDLIAVDETLRGLTEWSHPRVAAKFAVAEDLHPGILLHLQAIEDRLVFNLPQLLARDPAFMQAIARVEELLGADKAADLVNANFCVHAA